MRYIFDDRQDKIDIKDELYEKIEDIVEEVLDLSLIHI